MNSPSPSKENLDNPVPGINSDHVPAAISDRAGVRLEEDQADARLGQQDEGIDPTRSTRSFDATRQTCYSSTFRYVEENARHERFGTAVRSNTWLSRMCHDWPVITKPVTRTHAGTGCEQNWRRVKREDCILPENKHVWMQGNESNPLHQATNVLCQRNGIAHQRSSGEWVKRM